MGIINFQQLQASRGKRTKVLDLSAYGVEGSIVLGKLSVAGRDEFATIAQDQTRRIEGTAALLRVGILDPAMTFDQAMQLCQCDADVVDFILKEILAFNGMTQEAADDLKKQFPPQSRPEVPVHAGVETPHDGGGAGTVDAV